MVGIHETCHRDWQSPLFWRVYRLHLYPGADIAKWTLLHDAEDAGKKCWAMSSTNYTKKAIKEVEVELKQVGKYLQTKAPTPFTGGYCPQLDVTDELDAERQNYFQGLMGVETESSQYTVPSWVRHRLVGLVSMYC
jgi:hypothetical protein